MNSNWKDGVLQNLYNLFTVYVYCDIVLEFQQWILFSINEVKKYLSVAECRLAINLNIIQLCSTKKPLYRIVILFITQLCLDGLYNLSKLIEFIEEHGTKAPLVLYLWMHVKGEILHLMMMRLSHEWDTWSSQPHVSHSWLNSYPIIRKLIHLFSELFVPRRNQQTM